MFFVPEETLPIMKFTLGLSLYPWPTICLKKSMYTNFKPVYTAKLYLEIKANNKMIFYQHEKPASISELDN